MDASHPVSNARHESFARALAGSNSIAEAYRLAGFRDDRRHASRLATNGNVSARVEWFKKESATAATLERQEKREILAGIARNTAAKDRDRIAAIRQTLSWPAMERVGVRGIRSWL